MIAENEEFTIKNISPEMIKVVRKATRAGTIDCKQAIIESKGDVDKAIKLLIEKGNGSPKKIWV